MRLSGRQYLVIAACFVRTPSPTICLSECRGLSGRQHLVTSACFSRTPSPTFSSQGHRPLQKQKHWFGTSELSGRRGRRPLHFASQGHRPLQFHRKGTILCRNKNIGPGRQNDRDVSTSPARRASQGRRPLHFVYRDVSASLPRCASQGHPPPQFRRAYRTNSV